jgi:hypothetical protein
MRWGKAEGSFTGTQHSHFSVIYMIDLFRVPEINSLPISIKTSWGELPLALKLFHTVDIMRVALPGGQMSFYEDLWRERIPK